MGSAVLNKPPSPFITFVYCFLLISFLFYIPHRIVAQGERSGASSVHGSPLGHAPSAVQQGSPKQSSPTQNNPNSVAGKAVSCGRDNLYPTQNRGCSTESGKSLYNSDPTRSRSTESGESMYNWVEGETPSYNRGRRVTPGRH